MQVSTWAEWQEKQERRPAIWFMIQLAGLGPDAAKCQACKSYHWRRVAAPGGGFFGETSCEKAKSAVHWCGFWQACGFFERDTLREGVNSVNG